MNGSTVSVIVPTIGRPDALRNLLVSLTTQTTKPLEVIVADGSDTNAVAGVVSDQQWAATGLTVRRIAVTPPNAVAQRVAAIRQSRGELLLLLDDDVVLEGDCVEQLVTAIQSEAGVVGAFADFNNQTWPEPTPAWRFYLRYLLRMPEGAWQGRVIGPLLRFGYSPAPGQAAPIEWLGTCNTLVRRSAYDRAGGFSDFFLHRCTINEDVDLGLKIARLGTILFCPRARMGHFHAPGGRVSPAVAAEDDLHNRYLVLRRTLGRSAPAAFALVVLFFSVETGSNVIGGFRRGSWPELGPRTVGRLRALRRVLLA